MKTLQPSHTAGLKKLYTRAYNYRRVRHITNRYMYKQQTLSIAIRDWGGGPDTHMRYG